MTGIPLQRYANTALAFGVYGARPTIAINRRGVAWIALAVTIVALLWTGAIGPGGGLFLAGPVTLAQASLNAASAIDRRVIDEFRKSSRLLDLLPFVDSSNPAGGGSTLTYGYSRLITQRAAAFRAINAEYTPAEVTKAQYTTDLRPLGGSFQIDRVLADVGGAPAVAEVALQIGQIVKATKAKFADAAINGDTGVEADGFDGLSKALVGSTTEIAGPVLDLSAVNTQILALQAMQRINAALALMDGKPDALLMNGLALSWFTLVAQLSGQLRSTVDSFGQTVDRYNGIELIDVGEKAGSSALVIPTYGTVSEIQHIDLANDTGGDYTLTFNGQTTAAIAHDATTAAIVTALNLLSNLRSGDVVGSGAYPNHVLTFAQDYAGVNVPLITATDSTTGVGHSITITTATPGGTGAGGLTDIFAVRFGADAFHGVKVPGELIKTWLPDFTKAGAVKTGEVEMGPVSIALKASKAAAVIRNIRVA